MSRGMNKPRIKSLEKHFAHYSAPSDPSGQEWRPEKRAQAVKNITRHALASIGAHAIDPFPDLDERDYLPPLQGLPQI
jgi:hypothetical protein